MTCVMTPIYSSIMSWTTFKIYHSWLLQLPEQEPRERRRHLNKGKGAKRRQEKLVLLHLEPEHSPQA